MSAPVFPHRLLLLQMGVFPLLRENAANGMQSRTWAFNVADNASGLIIHEFNSDLSNTTTRT